MRKKSILALSPLRRMCSHSFASRARKWFAENLYSVSTYLGSRWGNIAWSEMHLWFDRQKALEKWNCSSLVLSRRCCPMSKWSACWWSWLPSSVFYHSSFVFFRGKFHDLWCVLSNSSTIVRRKWREQLSRLVIVCNIFPAKSNRWRGQITKKRVLSADVKNIYCL